MRSQPLGVPSMSHSSHCRPKCSFYTRRLARVVPGSAHGNHTASTSRLWSSKLLGMCPVLNFRNTAGSSLRHVCGERLLPRRNMQSCARGLPRLALLRCRVQVSAVVPPGAVDAVRLGSSGFSLASGICASQGCGSLDVRTVSSPAMGSQHSDSCIGSPHRGLTQR